MNMHIVDRILLAALEEDIGQGDVTTEACIPKGSVSSAILRAKESGVLCGTEVFARVFYLVDPAATVTFSAEDGDHLEKGDVFCTLQGPSRALLQGERLGLNLLQRMSGIATMTAEAAAAVAGTGAKIIDTRKTTPGLRIFEKYAVRVGGGQNHRYNLTDGVLIKENHITAAGGIAAAVAACRKAAPHTVKIEVETTDFAEVDEALAAGADIIMLDNMSEADMAEAVRRIGGKALVEASGNMGEKDLKKVADTGVDLISIGALTHRIRALDLSMVFDREA
ncbi:carboxylating nicotinate-nucleotide diphosphorylase [Oscillospiraceae bacterium OttesenSCG-928-F05]|nr:carboxylating nicotinate-nucleotide diphosphorylase [Oscillospiraceae bacterium OttesenSCG-928-F05]